MFLSPELNKSRSVMVTPGYGLTHSVSTTDLIRLQDGTYVQASNNVESSTGQLGKSSNFARILLLSGIIVVVALVIVGVVIGVILGIVLGMY